MTSGVENLFNTTRPEPIPKAAELGKQLLKLLEKGPGYFNSEKAIALIEAGADVNVKNKEGCPALYLATMRGYDNVLQAVIAAGADVNATNGWGSTALISAARNARTHAARTLLEHGAAIDAASENGDTALIVAARVGSTQIVRILIEAGADLHARDENGNTALMWAKGRENRVVEEIIEDALKKEALRKSPEWSLFDATSLAHIRSSGEHERTLTEIFNFSGRMLLTTTQNLQTGAESSAMTGFDHVAQPYLQEALEQFRALGGEADDAFVLHGHPAKPARLPGPGGI